MIPRLETTREALDSLRKSVDPYCKEMADRIQAAVERESASLLNELKVCSAEIGLLRMRIYSAPRNCDVGSANEMRSRMSNYCNTHLCGKCPFDSVTDEMADEKICVIRWMLAPYGENRKDESEAANG